MVQKKEEQASQTASSRHARVDFPNGVALVMGGSGGIGSAICRGLAEAGSDVVLADMKPGEEVAEEIRAQGRRAEARQISAEDADAVGALVEDVVARYGRIHSVVNAAGASIPMRFISQLPFEELQQVIENDVYGFFNLVKATLPHLRREGGSYVTVSSVGLLRWPDRDVLSVVPKAAINALIRGIAVEEGRFGVRANSVALGVIEAGMFLRLRGKDFDERWLDAARNNTALKRFGTAEEVADAVVFLASDRARYLTGQMLTVDGGFNL